VVILRLGLENGGSLSNKQQPIARDNFQFDLELKLVTILRVNESSAAEHPLCLQCDANIGLFKNVASRRS
jgi:hypothetical protein